MFDASAYADLMKLSYQHCTSIDCIHIVWRAERFLLMIPCCYRPRLISLYSMDYWRHRCPFCCINVRIERERREKFNIDSILLERIGVCVCVLKLIFATETICMRILLCALSNKCKKPIKHTCVCSKMFDGLQVLTWMRI